MIKELNVKGMHCKACETIIKESLGELSGVLKVSASAASGKVKVDYDEKKVSDKNIASAIKKEGYEVIFSK